MVLRIAGLPVFATPGELAGVLRGVTGWTDDAVAGIAALPARLTRLLDAIDGLVVRVEGVVDRADGLVGDVGAVLDEVHLTTTRVDRVLGEAEGLIGRVGAVAQEAEGLVARVCGVAGDAEGLVTRVDGVADGAQTLVGRVGGVADRAQRVVEKVEGTATGAGELLATYEPIARRAAPLARRFVDDLSEEEVGAAIGLVDQLPQLTEHLTTEIMPILATLDRVGPDVHELLDQLREVRHALQSIPGMRLLRRRAEDADNGP